MFKQIYVINDYRLHGGVVMNTVSKRVPGSNPASYSDFLPLPKTCMLV